MKGRSAVIVTVALVALLAINAYAVITLIDDGHDDPIPGYMTIFDIRDREVTIPEDVSKVVCIAAGSLRMVSYMGASDMVVGIDSSDSSDTRMNDYATYLLAYDYSNVPDVGDANNETSYKAIMESGAQVIIASKANVDELNSIQDMTGIPVVGIDAGGDVLVTDERFAENVRLVGKVLGKESRAEELISAVDEIITDEDLLYKAKMKAECYIGGLTYYKQSGLYMTSGNFVPFTLCGATNVMPYVKGLPYNIEVPTRLAEADPNFIFVDCINSDSCRNEYGSAENVLKGIRAVVDGNDYMLFASKYYGTNWETELMNAYLMSALIDDMYGEDTIEKMDQVLDVFFPDSDISVEEMCDIQGWQPGEGWL